MKRYCLVGVKGIGKTTLITSILNDAPTLEYVTGSSILRKLVGAERFQYFDNFPDNEKAQYRKQAIKYLEEMQLKEHKSIIVDGHVSLYNSASGKVDNVFTDLDINFYTDIILYDAQKETVLERRKNDKKKTRILEMDIIEKELIAEREEAIRICRDYNKNFYHLKDWSGYDIRKDLLEILLGSV